MALNRAQTLNAARRRPPGRYTLQAAIAAEHAIARTPERTNWPRLARLYTILARRFPSPVVHLNRVVAIAMTEGPDAALAAVDQIAATGMLTRNHLLPAVRGDLLVRLGRLDDAADEFDRAAAATANSTGQQLLHERATHCRSHRPLAGHALEGSSAPAES